MDIVRPVNSPRWKNRHNKKKFFMIKSYYSDCEGFCRVNVGCVAWTLATKDNVDIPAQCVLYSAVGAPVPYPNCISGKVHRIDTYVKNFVLVLNRGPVPGSMNFNPADHMLLGSELHQITHIRFWGNQSEASILSTDQWKAFPQNLTCVIWRSSDPNNK